jgi:hypothetical protein
MDIKHARVLLESLRCEGLGFVSLWPKANRSVPGWCGGTDARTLYAYAHHGPGSGAIVEIGSAWGKSTVFLASGAKRAKREKVYAIDPHTGDPWFLAGTGKPMDLRRFGYAVPEDGTFSSLDIFLQVMKRFGVDDWVTPVVATSTDAAQDVDTGPVRLLFVDGLHTYAGVRADIDAWVPRVIGGGVIVFDDYGNRAQGVGVRKAVDELVATGIVEPIRGTGGAHVWTLKR